MENTNNSIMWWGYLHTEGNFIIKRYYDEMQIFEAMESPFVEKIVGPVTSDNRVDAENILRELL